MRPLVLDTNVVLDLLVFEDPHTHILKQVLHARSVRWIATHAMRDELEHVLAYPHFVKRAQADVVLRAFDGHIDTVEPAPASRVLCTDCDDQKFIDLAIAHRATLVSKDNAVLKLRRKLAALDVVVAPFLSPT